MRDFHVIAGGTRAALIKLRKAVPATVKGRALQALHGQIDALLSMPLDPPCPPELAKITASPGEATATEVRSVLVVVRRAMTRPGRAARLTLERTPLGEQVARARAAAIERALATAGGNRTRAALALGCTPRTVFRHVATRAKSRVL